MSRHAEKTGTAEATDRRWRSRGLIAGLGAAGLIGVVPLVSNLVSAIRPSGGDDLCHVHLGFGSSETADIGQVTSPQGENGTVVVGQSTQNPNLPEIIFRGEFVPLNAPGDAGKVSFGSGTNLVIKVHDGHVDTSCVPVSRAVHH